MVEKKESNPQFPWNSKWIVKRHDFHSIIVDESSDVSNKEQNDFCVRWDDEDLISHQDFIGLWLQMEKLMPQVWSL